MEVILREDYPLLGYLGDVVNVARGYARNYLIPRGIAVEAKSPRAGLLKHKIEEITALKRKKKVEAEEFSKRFLGLTLEFKLKSNQHGRIFGSVSQREIVDALAEKGVEIDRKQIRLTEALRTAGTHEILVKLHSEISVPFKVAIVAIKPEKLEVKPKKEAKKQKADDIYDDVDDDNEDF
jgi:large subunit ribosomal protein L9